MWNRKSIEFYQVQNHKDVLVCEIQMSGDIRKDVFQSQPSGVGSKYLKVNRIGN